MIPGYLTLKSGFSKYLIIKNKLLENGFDRWLFYKGMLFEEKNKWWEKGGVRPTVHEGVDFCTYKNNDDEKICLSRATKVPTIFNGVVEKISSDLLGHSLFFNHGIFDDNGNTLLSIIAHVEPDPELYPGDIVSDSEIVATITDTKKTDSKLTSHIHISVVWVPESLTGDKLDWKYLTCSDSVKWVDPFKFISCPYVTIDDVLTVI